jgi:protein TonB
MAMHGMVLVALVAGPLLRLPLRPQPADPPSIEVVIGDGAKVSGQSQPSPDPAQPAPPPAPSAMPPPAQAAAAPASQAEPPPPPPSAAPTAPPASVPGDVEASASAPTVPPPPRPMRTAKPPQPQRQAAAPVPQQQQQQQPSPAAPSLNVNLGEGSAGAFALLGGGIVQPAKADSGNSPPQYPLEAARKHEHGTVVIGLRIDEGGNVVEAAVIQSSGSRSLDSAARDQLAMWHFHPATQNGTPVGGTATFEIHFE